MPVACLRQLLEFIPRAFVRLQVARAVDFLGDSFDLAPERPVILVEQLKVRGDRVDRLHDRFGELDASLRSVFPNCTLDDRHAEVGAFLHHRCDLCRGVL